MTFKNIPITGKLYDFVSKLESEGFEIKSESDLTTVLTGNFVNKNCEIYVMSTSISNTVWKVAIYLPEKESWSSLKSEYNRFVKQYTEKYGRPAKEFEVFSKSYYESEGYKIQELKDEYLHSTYWKTKKGYISVKINKSLRVLFGYEDAINSKLSGEESNRQVQCDI